ncbi:hypothetical protein P3T25_004747 [Paraburkholderia sp. GAS32]
MNLASSLCAAGAIILQASFATLASHALDACFRDC